MIVNIKINCEMSKDQYNNPAAVNELGIEKAR